jgi:spermidine synthase
MAGAPQTEAQDSGQPAGSRGYGLALGTLFLLSGALGLVYEVVWFRRLHLALGVSIFAVSAVVSAFMLGLALGSGWAARSTRVRRAPLETYAALELGVALYALAFPLLVGGLEALYPALHRLLEGHFLASSLARFLLAFFLLLPPTVLLGASLPAVAQAILAPAEQLARRTAWLYALNTAGGVAGTLAAGFFLVERLGLARSLRVGAAGSALVAAAALALARHPLYRRRGETPPGEAAPGRPRAGRQGTSSSSALAACAALTAGAVSLAAEIVWTRALVFFVHNSTYAFSAIVAVYLIAIAAGAALAARFARTVETARRALAAVLCASSAGLLLAIAAYRALPVLATLLAGGQRLAPGVTGAADTGSLLLWSWGGALVVIFGQAAAVLFLPAMLLGSVFPLALALASSGESSAAERVGRLYALNAIGSVLGTLLGTFVLVALLGTRGALLLLAWLPLPVALWAWREARPARRLPLPAAGAWLLALLGLSAAAAPSGFYRGLFEARFGRVLWFSEGISETVAVCEYEDGSRWIQFSDGRGASGTSSYQGGWLYAHLPLLLHPHPESAAVICFGTGNTLGAAAQHPLARLDGIELSRQVVAAAPFFSATNHDVVAGGRARIVIEDGRNYLLASGRRYDVITEEPPLVHTAGVVNLYSRDFYELCSRRLADDGVVAVWLATWELEPFELRMLVRAFVDAFPYASVWDCTHPYEWLLIGARTRPRLDLQALAARMAEPALARDLQRIDAERGGLRGPADLLSLHLMGREAMVRFAADSPPVTDDRSVVDFTTPRRARANFGLGEWVTGGLPAAGVGRQGLRSELGLRDFDRIYAFRDSPLPLVASYGTQDPAAFARELRTRAFRRELRAAGLTIGSVRRLAADLRTLGQPARSLETLDHALTLVPREASAPIQRMRAQLLREMRREAEARAADADAEAAERALAARRGEAPGP